MKAIALFTKKRMATTALLLLITILPIHAAQRTLQEMTSIAYSAFNLDESTADPLAVPPLAVFCKSSDFLDASLFTNNEEAFYIFAFTNNAPGYVVVSADTRLPEVLAYSASDYFRTDGMPEAVRAFFQSFVEKMKNIPESYVAKRRARGKLFANAATSTFVEPLLGNIAFNQLSPYNNACPVYNGNRCVTGCVATAMAQILKYYEYPKSMKGSTIDYTTSSYGIHVTWNPSSTTFDWTKIRDTYCDLELITPYTTNETVISTNQMSISGIDLSTYEYLYLQSFANISGTTLSFEAKFILTDNNGKFIQPVSKGHQYSDLPNNAYFNVFSLRHPTIPIYLSDGNYRLYVGIQKNGTSQWSYAKQNNNGSLKEFYLSVKKTGNYFTIEGSDYNYPCGYYETETAEMAKLHAACGASVKMDYGTGSSSASTTDAASALVHNFSYDRNLENLNPDFFTESNWHQYIQKELQAHRPILVSGKANNKNGHAFIIDGYRFDGSTPYYHINWGWDGSSNAYFLIDYMRPSEAGTGGSTDNYSYKYSLYCGIQPENNIDEGLTFGCSSYSVDKSVYSVGNTLILNISSDSELMNCSAESFTGEFNAYAVNGNHSYLLGKVLTYSDLGPGWLLYNITSYLTIPNSIPTGSYSIVMKSKESGSSVEKEVYSPTPPVVQINGNYILGDVDMSGNVDISDVVKMVNYILGSDSSANVLKYGDMDGSGTIDISDVVALVNLILSN